MHLLRLILRVSFPALAVAAWASQTAKPADVLASGDHESGVKVDLIDIMRDSPKVITVRWRYRNETNQPKQLTKQRTGGIDPYRLSLDSYLLDEDKKIKYEVSRGEVDNHPVASRNGSPNQYITIRPKSTIDVWAKYFVPDSTDKVTVAIDGVSPFGGIKVPK
jgi:hypothetical protein